MLGALVMLGWMIIRFGGQLAAPFAGEMAKVQFITERADGVSEGSGVFFRGVNVGRVIKVTRDKNLKDIRIDAEVEVDPPLPAGVTAIIRQASLLGSGARLELATPPNPDGQTLKSGATINASFVGLDFFPPEIRNLSTELAGAAKQFREANVVGNLNSRLDEIGAVLTETRVMLANANKLVGDDKMRQDIVTAVENVRIASENARSVTSRADNVAAGLEEAVKNIDKTSKTADTELTAIAKLTKTRLEEIAGVIKQANEITAKINEGGGTAAKIVNDPKLYQSLVETTQQLNATIKDVQRLVKQWEEEGATIKLN